MIKKCHVYTMSGKCPACGSAVRTAHPPRFAQADKYGRYRRMAKLKIK